MVVCLHLARHNAVEVGFNIDDVDSRHRIFPKTPNLNTPAVPALTQVKYSIPLPVQVKCLKLRICLFFLAVNQELIPVSPHQHPVTIVGHQHRIAVPKAILYFRVNLLRLLGCRSSPHVDSPVIAAGVKTKPVLLANSKSVW